jgi:hypothetical protein
VVDLRSDIAGDAIPAGFPASRDLSRNMAVGFESLGDKNPGTFLELLGVSLRDFHGLRVMDKLDFLVEDLLGIVSAT